MNVQGEPVVGQDFRIQRLTTVQESASSKSRLVGNLKHQLHMPATCHIATDQAKDRDQRDENISPKDRQTWSTSSPPVHILAAMCQYHNHSVKRRAIPPVNEGNRASCLETARAHSTPPPDRFPVTTHHRPCTTPTWTRQEPRLANIRQTLTKPLREMPCSLVCVTPRPPQKARLRQLRNTGTTYFCVGTTGGTTNGAPYAAARLN